MLTKEQYITVLRTWRNEKEHTALEHILYNVLRNKSSDEGFIELKSPGRLNACNNDKWFTYNYLVMNLSYKLNPKRKHFDEELKNLQEIFGIEFNEELVQEVLSKIKNHLQ